jgi:hypothetical protein
MAVTDAHAAARENLARAAERSKRGNVAYAREFVRTVNLTPDVPAPTPPLARLIQGGRGGEVRLRLYLLLTMMATQVPFDIRNPPTPLTLARTLALPQTSGPRRINDNMKWLEDERFIRRTKRPGQTAAIQLLDPLSVDHPLPDPRRNRPYVRIPIEFWSHGWLLALSPTGIAVLLALAERLGGYQVPMYLTRPRRESYGLSHDTWTRGRHELEDHGLLTVSRVPQGDDYDYRRLRNSYKIDKERLSRPPT